MTDVARLQIRADSNEVRTASRDLDGLERSSKTTSSGLNMVRLAMIGIAAVAARGIVRSIIQEQEQLQRNLLRTAQLIETTGRANERSADSMLAQARQIARATLQTTEGVMKAQQTLLTFRNITGDVFDEAIKGAVDLASAMGTDLNSATLQLAKALEDPITGMSALTRSGTVFTQAQRDMVREMVETNRTMEAQQFILGELRSQYGGVAEAEAKGVAGAQDNFKQSLQEATLAASELLNVGARLESFFNGWARTLDAAARAMNGYNEANRRTVDIINAQINSLGTLNQSQLVQNIIRNDEVAQQLQGQIKLYEQLNGITGNYTSKLDTMRLELVGIQSIRETQYNQLQRLIRGELQLAEATGTRIETVAPDTEGYNALMLTRLENEQNLLDEEFRMNLERERLNQSVADEIARINEENNLRLIEQDTAMWEKRNKLAEESTSAMTVFAEQAARNMQDGFAQFLFDPFGQGIDGMLKGFSNMLRQMAAQAASSAILGAIFGAMGGSSVGWVSTLGKSMSGIPSADGGGFTGNAPRSGGMDGKGGFMAMVHPQETIVDHTKGQGQGVNVNFNIQANDARGFREMLMRERGSIVSMVSQAVNNQGKAFPA